MSRIGTLTHTEVITELSAALAKAQGQIKGAAKDSENPHFRSKYADLASVWEACRKPLADNGLSVVQSPRLAAVGEGWFVEVETMLLHSSGQWITDTLAVPVTKVDAQGVGSAITYERRYALSAIVGVAPEDDGAEASIGPRPAYQSDSAPPPAGARNVSDGPTRIVAVATKLTSTGKKQWTVEFSDRVKATTIHEKTGVLCDALHR